MPSPVLSLIDAALKAVGKSKIDVLVSSDEFVRLAGDVERPEGQSTALYRGVLIRIARTRIPEPGYSVNARFA